MKRSLLILFLAALLMIGVGADAYAKKKKMTKEEKAAAKLAKQEEKITSVLGTNSNWKPTVFAALHKGMTCDEVAQHVKGLDCRSASAFKKVSKGLGTVSEYSFYFMRGQLYSVTIKFGARLFDEKRFTAALMSVVQKKWGPIENPQDIRWKTPDFNVVKLKYNRTNWELEFQFPSFNPGDVNVEALDENTLRAEFQKFLGDNSNCMPAYFTQFKYNMSWEELRQMFPDLEYDSSKTMNYPRVSIKGHPLLAGLKLRLDSGLLEHVTAVFHWQLPRDLFKQISYEEMKAKYGEKEVDADEELKDRISVYMRPCGFITREWSTNRWEISMPLPKKGGGKVTTAPPSKTKVSRINLVGDWKLAAIQQGSKVEKAEADMVRSITFTEGKEMLMKENGKVVANHFYKVVGKTIFLTSGKGGKAIKTFGKIKSKEGNKLIVRFTGQAADMVFVKM